MSNEAVDLFEQFATDETKEEKGAPTPLPDCGATLFYIARAGNSEYNKLLNTLYKRNRAVLDSKGKAADAKSNEILAEVYSKTILVGWDGTIRYQKKDMSYSQAAAKTLLLHKDFRAKVEAVATDAALFKAVTDEEDTKNSTPILAG